MSTTSRHSFITDQQKELLKADLSENPEAFGYNTANWSGPLLRKHLETAYGKFILLILIIFY